MLEQLNAVWEAVNNPGDKKQLSVDPPSKSVGEESEAIPLPSRESVTG